MAAAGAAAAAAVAAGEAFKVAFSSFMPGITNLVTNVFDKVGFDSDYDGRKREIEMLEEQLRSEYERRGVPINIAIWNMYIREDHHFEQILMSGLSRMGNGGGFRIVAFQGWGHLQNHGDGGYSNWLCSGNITRNGAEKLIRFRPVGDMYVSYVKDVLRELLSKFQAMYQESKQFLAEDGGRRNELAENAASDHCRRAEGLLNDWARNPNKNAIVAQLRDCKNHAEIWQGKFAEWSVTDGHTHSYGERIHRQASGFYQGALNDI